MLAISVDSAEESKALAEQVGDVIPLLSDPTREVIDAYGVSDAAREIAVTSTFLIAPDRTIALRYVGESVTDRPSVDRLVEAASKL